MTSGKPKHMVFKNIMSATKRFSSFNLLGLLLVLTLILTIITVTTVEAQTVIWKQTSDPSSSGFDIAYEVAVDTSGIYVVGNSDPPSGGEWRIEKRSLTTGVLMWEKTSDPSSGDDEAFDVTVDSTGVYIVGVDRSSGTGGQWRIEKRNLADGSLITSFGTGGVVTSNPSAGEDVARSIAVDSTGIYIVGYDSTPGFFQWRIEKRSLTDGSLIWQQTSVGGDASGVTVDNTAVYVVGGDGTLGPGDLQWRIEKRSLINGSLISSFGTGGIVTNNPSTGMDHANSVAVDGTGIYIVGTDESPGSGDLQWRIEKRSLTDGSLIWQQTDNLSNEFDIAFDVAVDNAGVYVVGIHGLTVAGPRIEKRSFADGSLLWQQTSIGGGAFGVALDLTGAYRVGVDGPPEASHWIIEKIDLGVTPVGGVLIPVNEFHILAPYLTLVGSVTAAFAYIAAKKKSKH